MEALERFRKEKGYSKEQMAKILGISCSFYEKVEGGQRNISGNFLKKLKEQFPEFDVNIFFES